MAYCWTTVNDEDQHAQHEGEGGAEAEVPEDEGLLVDLGRQRLGGARRPATGERQDLVEDAQSLDQRERGGDRDGRLDESGP